MKKIVLLCLMAVLAGTAWSQNIALLPTRESWISGNTNVKWGVTQQQILDVRNAGVSNVWAAYLSYNPGTVSASGLTVASVLLPLTGTTTHAFSLYGVPNASWTWDTLTASNAPAWSVGTYNVGSSAQLLATGTQTAGPQVQFSDSRIANFLNTQTNGADWTFIVTQAPGTSCAIASDRSTNSIRPVLLLTAPVSVPEKTPTITSTLSGSPVTRPDGGFSTRAQAVLARAITHPFPPLPSPTLVLGPSDTLNADLTYAVAELATSTTVADANTRIAYSISNALNPAGTALVDEANFHWYGNILFRIYELYSSGTGNGTLTSANEAAIKNILWVFSSAESTLGTNTLATAQDWDPWHFWGSENHGLMRDSTYWSAAALLKDDPSYNTRTYADGSTPGTLYTAWSARFRQILTERIRKVSFLEYCSPTYEKYSLQCIYNFADFGGGNFSTLATALLDVVWSEWAQEQAGGITGGARIRAYPGASSENWEDTGVIAGWYYTGLAPINPSTMGTGDFYGPGLACIVTSAYRPPAVVAAIAAARPAGTEYEVLNRLTGLVRRQNNGTASGNFGPDGTYHVDGEAASMVHYSWVTEDFTLGSLRQQCRPGTEISAVTSQNPWIGAVYKCSDPSARIFLQPVVTTSDTDQNNPEWSVQAGGTLIAQELPAALSRGVGAMQVYIPSISAMTVSTGGSGTPGTWTFVQCGNSFTAIMPLVGGWTSTTQPYLVVANNAAPVVMQVDHVSTTVPDMATFKTKVLAQVWSITSGVVHFTTYDGNVLTLDTTYATLPTINGSQVQLAPTLGRDGPDVSSNWDGTQVNIHFGSYVHTITLN